MALQLSTSKYGVTFASAYYKVSDMQVSKEGVEIYVHLLTEQGGEKLDTLVYSMDYAVNGGEPLTQAYNYLKTLPEYAGATDV